MAHNKSQMVQAVDISHHYPGKSALTNINLEVLSGERVALIGPSGSGKTTFLRILAGLLRPSTGSVFIGNYSVQNLSHRKELANLVGMVQQRLDLIPQLSVRNNVESGLLGQWSLCRSLISLLYAWPNKASEEAMKQVALYDRKSYRVATLSGGEQQRVAIARVLVQDPQLILADEPVASLDPNLADEILCLLSEIAVERRRTVIASLHIPDLAQRHFDRVIGLKNGHIVFDVSPNDLSPIILDDLYSPGTVGEPSLSES